MKVILSRKGFDSSNGGCPSPILPDGTLLSLPIPTDDRDRRSHTVTLTRICGPASGPQRWKVGNPLSDRQVLRRESWQTQAWKRAI